MAQILEAPVVFALTCTAGLNFWKPSSLQVRQQCLGENALSSFHPNLICTSPSRSSQVTCLHKWIWYLPGVYITCDCALHSPCSCQSHKGTDHGDHTWRLRSTFPSSALPMKETPFTVLTTSSLVAHWPSLLPVASVYTCSLKMGKGLQWLELGMQVKILQQVHPVTFAASFLALPISALPYFSLWLFAQREQWKEEQVMWSLFWWQGMQKTYA